MFKKKKEKIRIIGDANEKFSGFDGDIVYSMERERGYTPDGIAINHRWVLRVDGEFVDYDMYRADLAERNNFDLVDNSPEPPPIKERDESSLVVGE